MVSHPAGPGHTRCAWTNDPQDVDREESPATATVEIPLPLAAECWQCGEVNYLNVIAPADIIAMATRTWCCDPCNNPDEFGQDSATQLLERGPR